MLTAVLDRLTSLTSKAFIIGAFVPVLAFAFLNGVVLYLGFGWFRAWAEPQSRSRRARSTWWPPWSAWPWSPMCCRA